MRDEKEHARPDSANAAPGPWSVVESIERSMMGGEDRVNVIVTSPRGYVAEMTKTHKDDGLEYKRANARLIAAAPDLFNACRAMLYHYSDRCPQFLVEKLERAVAKAGGAA